MRHQQAHPRILASGFAHGLIQLGDAGVELVQKMQQVFPPPLRPRWQCQLFQPSPPALRPQLPLLVQAFIQGHMLQLVLDPRPHLDQLVTMQHQFAQIALSRTRHPDGGKLIAFQQLEQVLGIARVRLLLAYRQLANARRIAHH